MSLPSTHRWIALGNLKIRKDMRASANAPSFTLEEVMNEAKTRLSEGNHFREHGPDKSRLMWFSNFSDDDQYYLFLAEVGDKNTAGVSFIDFNTRESRDIKKGDNEGSQFTAHVATDEKGIKKNSKPVFEIDGFQSSTIRDALRNGSLQDIEFVKTDDDYEDGLDEDPIIREKVYRAKWDIKRQVTENQANSIFGKMRAFFRDKFRDGSDKAQLFVRIKTAAGQVKQTEVINVEESTLEQAFIQNEKIEGFDRPLAQRHEGIRQDIIEKMLKIPNKDSQGISDNAP